MNLYKKYTTEPYSFFVIHTTLLSDSSSRFRKKLLGTIQKLIMTIDNKIKDEKLQYDINREAAKISALSSGEIDKYEFITGEEILPSDYSTIMEQAKSTYFPLGKAFEKQTKTIEERKNNNNNNNNKKQIDAITNQNKRLKAFTNKGDHKSIYKEIFDILIKEKFDEIK